MKNSALLQIENLSIMMADRAGPVTIIDDLSLTIRPNEIIGLAGESGCGKSTLAKAILRIVPPPGYISSGHIWYEGRDILDMSAAEMQAFRWRQAAMVFQNALNALNPVLSVRDQLLDTLRCHRSLPRREAHDLARDMMELVGLKESHLACYPHELSGGMRQRVMIAIALLLQAPLLILDEPTTALDVVVQREILLKIVELQARRNFSVLFVTHDLPLMTAYCDRIAILYAGRIVECGTSRQIAEAPQHPYTRGLMASFPSIDGERLEKRGIAGYPPGFTAKRAGCSFRPRCASACREGENRVPSLQLVSPAHQVACHRPPVPMEAIPHSGPM